MLTPRSMEFCDPESLCLPRKEACLPRAYPVLTPEKRPAYPVLKGEVFMGDYVVKM